MKILIVDDEVKIANALSERLALRGFVTAAVYDGTSALERLASESFDAMLLDLRLPDMDGIEVLRGAKRIMQDLRVVILSGHGSEAEFQHCRVLGASACFQKPPQIQELVNALAGE